MALDNTTATLTAAGLAGLPNLKGPLPFASGSYGYPGRPRGRCSVHPLAR